MSNPVKWQIQVYSVCRCMLGKLQQNADVKECDIGRYDGIELCIMHSMPDMQIYIFGMRFGCGKLRLSHICCTSGQRHTATMMTKVQAANMHGNKISRCPPQAMAVGVLTHP